MSGERPGGRVKQKLNMFQEACNALELDDTLTLDFDGTLDLLDFIFFKRKGEKTYSIDELSKKEIWTITGDSRKITIIGDLNNETIDGIYDPRIAIFGGEKLIADSGIEIHTRLFEDKNEQLKLIVITGLLRAITFSFSLYGKRKANK